MFRFLVLIFLLSACAHMNKTAEGELAFLPDIEGVPIYEGFAVNEDKRSFYDSPDGKVAEIVIEGEADGDAVSAFYAETLPQLGWEQQKEGGFKRGKEALDLEVSTHAHRVAVKFSLQPAD